MAAFICPSCGTRYRVADKKLARVTTVRCKSCRTKFSWQEHVDASPEPELPPESFQPEASNGPQRVSQADFLLPAGTVLKDRYRIEQVLGQGGMGVTYKAVDLSSGEPVAIKLLHFSRMQDWKTLEMFEREAAILKQLKHPQIPAYLDYASDETRSDVQFMLAQEYIDGKTLEQLVEEGWHCSEDEAGNILTQLLDVLEYLHTLNPPVIHRDINPKNIILTAEKRVYLVDFGAVQERIRTTVYGSSTIVGTYGYAPFEQFSGHTVPASDYYALGATLLFLLSHRHPSEFPTEGMKPRFADTLNASPKFMRILDALLEPSVENRVASPGTIRRMLLSQAIEEITPSIPAKRPYGTKIRKEKITRDHLQFRIPGSFNAGSLAMLGFSVFWLAFVAFWTVGAAMGSIFFAMFSIPFWIVGIGMFSAAMYGLFGKTTLDLTPHWIEVRYKFLGLGYSQRIPTAAVGNVTKEVAYTKNNQPVEKLTISAGAKSLRFGSNLSEDEKDWLKYEIEDYVTTYGRPLLGGS